MTDEAILADPQDAEECVSDAWLKAWKACRPTARRRREADEILHGKKGEAPQKPGSPDPLTAQPPTAYHQRSGVWSVKKAM